MYSPAKPWSFHHSCLCVWGGGGGGRGQGRSHRLLYHVDNQEGHSPMTSPTLLDGIMSSTTSWPASTCCICGGANWCPNKALSIITITFKKFTYMYVTIAMESYNVTRPLFRGQWTDIMIDTSRLVFTQSRPIARSSIRIYPVVERKWPQPLQTDSDKKKRGSRVSKQLAFCEPS